jgi:predicted membrane-bound dolichyl-phosphate-mannose-protein mannosyltransferase
MGYLIFAIYSVFFLFFQTNTIYGGDGGDFVAAALSGGFAHAPGYPLYSILGYLLTKLPFETPAWRVSLLSSIPAALTLTVLYLLIKKQTSSKFAGIIASATLGLTYVFWLYSVVPEVFILAIFFSTSIFYLLYLWSEHGNNKLLYISIFLLGLSLAHHHIIAFMFPAYAFIVLKNKNYSQKRMLQLLSGSYFPLVLDYCHIFGFQLAHILLQLTLGAILIRLLSL